MEMKILYIVPYAPWEERVRSLNLIPRLAKTHLRMAYCRSNVAQEAVRRRYAEARPNVRRPQ
jgi:hypothetical protein